MSTPKTPPHAFVVKALYGVTNDIAGSIMTAYAFSVAGNVAAWDQLSVALAHAKHLVDWLESLAASHEKEDVSKP